MEDPIYVHRPCYLLMNLRTWFSKLLAWSFGDGLHTNACHSNIHSGAFPYWKLLGQHLFLYLTAVRGAIGLPFHKVTLNYLGQHSWTKPFFRKFSITAYCSKVNFINLAVNNRGGHVTSCQATSYIWKEFFFSFNRRIRPWSSSRDRAIWKELNSGYYSFSNTGYTGQQKLLFIPYIKELKD